MANILLIVLVILVILAAIAFAVYYYLEHFKKNKPALHEDYVWVGQGNHPLKEMKTEEKKE